MNNLRFPVIALCTLSLPLLGADRPEYLALGDSVAFGYNPLVAVPNEANYTGYPEIVALKAPPFKRHESLACPGETSGSFLSATAPDRGCREYKALFGLHTPYVGTQADYAIWRLGATPQIKLVTISLGGNDLLLLQTSCQNQPDCILAGIPALLGNYAQNLTQIFARIRGEARYRGRIVVVTYYSPDYRDPVQTSGVGALNAVSTLVAARFGATVADGFGAFAAASAASGGNTCAAGLLVRLSPTSCDEHPSRAGQNLLAATILRQLPAGGRDRED